MRRAMAMIPLLLALVAVAEIAAFALVTRWVGLPAAVLVALGTSVVGVLLLRREGVRAWRRYSDAIRGGEPPGVRVADGLVGLVGALLLTIPGFLSDALGVLLLLPVFRPLARYGVRRAAEARMPSRLAGDVFGPRRVRVRRGPARPDAPPAPTATDPEPVAGLPGPVVEGEIVDPDGPR